jgi:hypothetical protein
MLALVTMLGTSLLTGYAASQTLSNNLASPESFADIADQDARSAAIFTELGKVLTHPRCMNCHPAGDRPRQGEGAWRRLHQPPVARGADGHGMEAMRCSICHGNANFEPGRMPGHPEWHLAPREMGREGKTLAEICEQLRDPARNGWRSLGIARRRSRIWCRSSPDIRAGNHSSRDRRGPRWDRSRGR